MHFSVVRLAVIIDAADDGGKLRARQRPVGKIRPILIAVDNARLIERLCVVIRGVYKVVFLRLALQTERVCGDLCH